MTLKITILLLAILLPGRLVLGQSASFQKLVEEHLLSFPNNSEIAIGIVDGDKTYKLGYRVTEGKLTAVDNASTLYEIGSVSKTFVAALLANEIEKGTMSLEDPIQQHLTVEMRRDTYGENILSILHLVTHTSGLKKNPIVSYARYLKYLTKFELDYVPGKKWEYNNMGVGLVGELVAEKNNSTWSDVLSANILKPLQMNSTFSNLQQAPEVGRVQCIKKNGTRGDCYFHKMGSFSWPSGGIISNVEDMTKWLKANLNEEIEPELAFIQNTHDPLGDTIAIQWFTRHQPTQGIVWWHYRSESGERIIGHGGAMPQQSSFMAMDKEKRRGVLILTNVKSSELFIKPETSEMTDKKILLALEVLAL